MSRGENSETEEKEEEENWELDRSRTIETRVGQTEVDKDKIKSNLEILLSQNDILPLLKKINRECGQNTNNVSLSKYAQINKVCISIKHFRKMIKPINLTFAMQDC
jgi:hypothetical protein